MPAPWPLMGMWGRGARLQPPHSVPSCRLAPYLGGPRPTWQQLSAPKRPWWAALFPCSAGAPAKQAARPTPPQPRKYQGGTGAPEKEGPKHVLQ